MSIYQCDLCGCLENTALSNAYSLSHNASFDKEFPEVADSYRAILGLRAGEAFGAYCSVCSPIWFTADGTYGKGPRHAGHKERLIGRAYGVWHDRFERIFLPKGLFHTNDDGNLAHVETLEVEMDKYRLPAEDEGPWQHLRCKARLPRPGSREHELWLALMAELLPTYKERPETKEAVDKLGGLPHLISLLVSGQATIGHKDVESPNDVFSRLSKSLGGKLSPHYRENEAPQNSRRSAGQPSEKCKKMPEEMKRKEERSAARIAKAEEKRRRRAEKRGKILERNNQRSKS